MIPTTDGREPHEVLEEMTLRAMRLAPTPPREDDLPVLDLRPWPRAQRHSPGTAQRRARKARRRGC